MGQGGAPPSKTKLPGVKRDLITSQSHNSLFVKYSVPGQTTKLLIPSNVPYKPTASDANLKYNHTTERNTRNSWKGNALFASDDEV